jgi:hypothetical protein
MKVYYGIRKYMRKYRKDPERLVFEKCQGKIRNVWRTGFGKF